METDKCPTCGAVRYDEDNRCVHLVGGVDCLRNQLASRDKEIERLRGQLNSVVGYVTTCRSDNTAEWMIGLEKRINHALEAMGDTDRVKALHFGNEWSFAIDTT